MTTGHIVFFVSLFSAMVFGAAALSVSGPIDDAYDSAKIEYETQLAECNDSIQCADSLNEPVQNIGFGEILLLILFMISCISFGVVTIMAITVGLDELD